MGNIAAFGAGQAQHLQALEHANRVRLARAEMKRRIAAGDLPAAEVILSCPWEAESMSISDVLMSQKRPRRVMRFLCEFPAMLATTFGCWSRIASASSVSGLWLKTRTQRSVVFNF